MRKLTMTENMTPIDKKLIEKGMTRSDLSKQSGVPLRTIESWCRRLRVPRDVYQLLKLAKVLGAKNPIEADGEQDWNSILKLAKQHAVLS